MPHADGRVGVFGRSGVSVPAVQTAAGVKVFSWFNVRLSIITGVCLSAAGDLVERKAAL